jgi:hypothetical protein
MADSLTRQRPELDVSEHMLPELNFMLVNTNPMAAGSRAPDFLIGH